MTEDALDQKEAVWNAKTDKWLQRNSRHFPMKWMMIHPDVCITPKLIWRYFMTLSVILAVSIWILSPLVGSSVILILVAAVSYWSNEGHLVTSQIILGEFEAIMTTIGGVYIRLTPVFIWFVFIPSAIMTLSLFRSAKYWNRRALRLQKNPTTSAIMPDPGVWPPPPRIAD